MLLNLTHGRMEGSVSIRDLRGRRVIDKMGNDVGVIDDVALDPDGWRVGGFVVRLKRELAEKLQMRGGFLEAPRVELTTGRIASVGDNVLLAIDREEMMQVLRGQEPEGRQRRLEDVARIGRGRVEGPPGPAAASGGAPAEEETPLWRPAPREPGLE